MQKLRKNIRNYIEDYGRETLIVLIGLVVVGSLLWFRIGSLTYGRAAEIEAASILAAGDWHTLVADPLNAPYTALQYFVTLLGHNGITSMRLVTTVWAIVAIGLFYIVARQWHSMRVAALATWLFISSAWFLHTARLATPEILWLVAILALVVLFSPRKEGRFSWLSLPTLSISLALTLYVPAMVWLLLLSVVIRRKNIAEAWQASTNWFLRVVSVVFGLVLVAPLVRALYIDTSLIGRWLGFDGSLEAPLAIAKQFLAVPKQLFISGPLDPVHWLGRLPLLSVFEIVMFVLGAYFYASHLKAARSRFILVLSMLAWILIAVGGVASLSLIVPVVYLVLTTGVAYMLHEWFKVFPTNPVARALGIVVVATAILLTSIYQTRSYFVAWRYSPDTAEVFTQKL